MERENDSQDLGISSNKEAQADEQQNQGSSANTKRPSSPSLERKVTAATTAISESSGEESEKEAPLLETSLSPGTSVVVSETVAEPKGVLAEPEFKVTTSTSQETQSGEGELESKKPASISEKKKLEKKSSSQKRSTASRRQNRPMAESLPGAFASQEGAGTEALYKRSVRRKKTRAMAESLPPGALASGTVRRPASSSTWPSPKSIRKTARADSSSAVPNEPPQGQNRRPMAESLPGAFAVGQGTRPRSSRQVPSRRKQRSKRPQAASLPVKPSSKRDASLSPQDKNEGPSIYISEEMTESNPLNAPSSGHDEVTEEEGMTRSFNANARSMSDFSQSVEPESEHAEQRGLSERSVNTLSRRSLLLQEESSRRSQRNALHSEDLEGHGPDRPNLISATLVQEDDSPIIAAAEVVSEEKIRRRRILIGAAVVILVAGLVTAIVLLTAKNRDDGEGDVVDPRCLVPINEQIVTTQCICQGEITAIPENSTELAEQLLFALQGEGVLDSNFTVNQTACTPENQALWWVADPRNIDIPIETLEELRGSRNFPLFISGVVQRFILVLLYFSMGGDNWERQDKWLDKSPVCEWFGITCALSFRVTFLELPANRLTGEIPKQIGFLSHLQTLILGFNPLMTGTLPSELSKMRSLRVLDIRNAGLGGTLPRDFYQLDVLSTMILNNNSLTGTVPSDLASLPLLTGLDLGDNFLTGTLFSEVGNMTNLGILNLQHNMMTGPIPNDIVNAKNLQMIKIAGNQFRGTLPEKINSLSLLGTLDLKNNLLNGTIPESLANLERLSLLSLSGNQFQRTVPETICQEVDFLDAVIVDCVESETFGSACSCCYCEESVLGGFAGL